MAINKLRNFFRAQVEAEATSDFLPQLPVEARKVAQTIMLGLRSQSEKGPGGEFLEHEDYDRTRHEARQIDHRQSARAGRMMVRQHQMEKHQTYLLWRDNRPGMNWAYNQAEQDLDRARSGTLPANRNNYTKRQEAEILMMAVANLAMKAEDRVTMINSEKRPSPKIEPMIEELAAAPFEDQTAWATLGRRGRPLPARGHVLLFSDFAPDQQNSLEDMKAAIMRLSRGGLSGHLMQILSPAEIDFPYQGTCDIQDAAGYGPVYSHGEIASIRDEYRARLQAHMKDIAAIARQAGWGYSVHRTDEPRHTALIPLYRQPGPSIKVPDILSHDRLEDRPAKPGKPAPR